MSLNTNQYPPGEHEGDIQTPSVASMQAIAADLRLEASREELEQYQGLWRKWTDACAALDAMPEPCLPVKYPRTPGYRPNPEENPFNAWAIKTSIQGAAEGKLKGRTVAIKDSIAVAGVPMSNGSHLLQGYTPEFDATVVTRILDAGGTICGKAACEDMCFSYNSFTSATGPVPNPYDVTRSAGGSSSGPAVLVATGAIDMAVGTDQGGSVRSPAARCGIVGMKPTFGLIPYTGACAVGIHLDCLGPMARTVWDCALLLEVIAGFDNGLDPRQTDRGSIPEYTKHLSEDLTGLKVGLLQEGFAHCDPDVASLVRSAATRLTALGAHVRDISVPVHSRAGPYMGATYATYNNMILHAGCPPGMPGFQPTSLTQALHDGFRSRARDAPPIVKATWMFGEYIKDHYGQRLQGKSMNLARTLRAFYDEALTSCHVIIMPTCPSKPHRLPVEDISLKEFCHLEASEPSNMRPFNTTGHPAISVPAGLSQGLPVGLMVVGRHYDDVTVLRIAHGIEKVQGVD